MTPQHTRQRKNTVFKFDQSCRRLPQLPRAGQNLAHVYSLVLLVKVHERIFSQSPTQWAVGDDFATCSQYRELCVLHSLQGMHSFRKSPPMRRLAYGTFAENPTPRSELFMITRNYSSSYLHTIAMTGL